MRTLFARLMPDAIATGAVAALLLIGGALSFAAGLPTEVVRATINEVIRILLDEEMKKPGRLEERRRLLENVIGNRFDYEEMSKRTLAAHWNTLSDAEKQEFVELFKAFLSHVYGDKIEGYSGEQVEYLQERLEGAYAEVRTKIVSEKLVLPMDYRLLSKSGNWRVYDVIADGVSLVKNYRGQFDKIIRESSYADLVEKLRKKSQEIKPPKPVRKSQATDAILLNQMAGLAVTDAVEAECLAPNRFWPHCSFGTLARNAPADLPPLTPIALPVS